MFVYEVHMGACVFMIILLTEMDILTHGSVKLL